MPKAAKLIGVVPGVLVVVSVEPNPNKDSVGAVLEGPQIWVVKPGVVVPTAPMRLAKLTVPWANMLTAVVSAKAASISFFIGVCFK
jgi:hypothetical protein